MILLQNHFLVNSLDENNLDENIFGKKNSRCKIISPGSVWRKMFFVETFFG